MVNVRLALRTLFKAPSVTILAIVSIAFGIGANTAIFSIFELVVMRTLPVNEPARLVNLDNPGPKPESQNNTQEGGINEVFSYPMFRDLEKAQTVFTGIAAHCQFFANLAARGETLSGRGLLVSGSYFPVLGVRAALGRLLDPEDDRTIGESHVVVLSHSYWKSRFGRDPNVLNQTMIINGQLMTIVGVAQSGFEGTTWGLKPEVFVPITMRGFMSPVSQGGREAEELNDRRWYWVYLFARLKPEVRFEQASAALNVRYHAIVNDVEAPLQKGMSAQTLAYFRTKPIVLSQGSRGHSTGSEGSKTPLSILLGLAGFVLVIACANVANLLVTRGTVRAGEMAVRLSIGASRKQVLAQLLLEYFLLALISGVAGILAARWTLDLILSLIPAQYAALFQFSIDVPALLFAAALTLGTGLLFGLFPALHSTRLDLVKSLKGQAGQSSGARSATRFRTTLAVVQIMLSLALLVVAGLLARSLLNIGREDLGMKVDNVITFGISPSLNGYTNQHSLQLYERLEDEIASMPGVTSVTNSLVPLLSQTSYGTNIHAEGYQAGADADTFSRYNGVGPAYLRTLGIPLVSGREFRRSDASGRPRVAIVNQVFTEKFHLGRNALGKHIGIGGGPLDTEIIGLVQNTKSDIRTELEPLVLYPYRQGNRIDHLTFYVQTSLNSDQLFLSIKKLMAQLDPNLPIENLRAMPQQVSDSMFGDRLFSVLSGAFACLATLLAAVGLYGVLAYTVTQRTREIGLRLALGASRAQVRAMVLKQMGRILFMGGFIGLGLAIALGRLMQSMLYQLQGFDPVVLCGSTAILALVALIAGFFPAQRASKIDPMQAMRYE